ncbi:hypothetical protein [Sinorhizobium meliloti]|uniref:hypothetical protein n=1 Tax=Rhizobium meliloti TaxID=382 RepID=UPI001F159C6C|nr:hypothetical protein [Sinorhizobium meliloti]
MDRYTDGNAAASESTRVNAQLEADLKQQPMDEHLRRSFQLKTAKALQAKERLRAEEALMLAEAKRRNASLPTPRAESLVLTPKAEKFRDALTAALAEFPYVTGIRIGELSSRIAMIKSYEGVWDVIDGVLSRRGAVLIERSKIASGFGLNPTNHWGEVKAEIRRILLPRANQLLQLASVRRLLDEALARGEKVLVCNGVVFWYEEHGQVGWQVKTTGGSQTEDKNTLWLEGTIVSANHGRLVILPFIKENGEHVKGHTRNAPKDGPAKPRHPSQYVEIPFTRLNDDLMVGLFGELPYE